MAVGSGLAHLGGYPFEVRYSKGSLVRARAMADLAADAYVYFRRLFSSVEPEIAVVVAEEADWHSSQPFGLAFFSDEAGEIRPGVVVMPVGGGDFWVAMVRDLRDATPRGYAKLRATYPDGGGGVDLQPFFDLITIHEPVLRPANALAFEATPAAPGFVLGSSCSSATRRILRPRQSSAGVTSRCQATYGTKH
jgi:hypothetical protein